MKNLMLNRKYLLVFFLLSIPFLTLHCQQMAPEDIHTPYASDLGKYGNIPISYYTGRPQVSIPIHTLDVRGKKLPVSLCYDTSGVLVNSLPGWTGHNWTLMSGGAIIRSLQNLCDEWRCETPSPYEMVCYFDSHDRICNDILHEDTLQGNLRANKYDYAPDIFYFNFLDKSGRFFLGNDGQWKVACDENIDIIFNVEDTSNYIYPFIDRYPSKSTSSRKQPKSIKGFIIRDDEGYIYEFGGTSDAIDYSIDFFNHEMDSTNHYLYASAWYLTSIKDKYENLLYKLDYERGCYVVQLYNNGHAEYHVEKQSADIGLPGSWDDLGSGGEVYYENYNFPYGGTLNSPVYLKRISGSDSANIEFISVHSPLQTEDLYPYIDIFKKFEHKNYSANPTFPYLQLSDGIYPQYQYPNSSPYVYPLQSTRLRELQQINICFGSSVRKNVKLNYDYTNRMLLTSVKFNASASGDDALSYNMSYDTSVNLPQDYLSRKADHWGYYNGRVCNAGSNDIYTIRNADISYAQSGILKEIIYPTGGMTSFEYENHDFSSYLSIDRSHMRDTIGIAGGLRVKAITDYTDVSKNEIANRRTFSYKMDDGSSSGELFAKPLYHWTNWYPNAETSGSEIKITFLRSSSIIPLANSFGPHIGYSSVKETNTDGSYTIYRYHNISAAKDERFILDFSHGMPSPYDMFTEHGYKRGKLLSETSFGTDGQMTRKVKYSYAHGDLKTDSVLTSNLKYHNNIGNSAAFGYFSGGVYKLLFPKYDIVADTATTYFGTDSITEYRQYLKINRQLNISYPYTHKVKIRNLFAETTKRAGEYIQTVYTYPFMLSNPFASKLYSDMFDLTPVETKNYYCGKMTGGRKTAFRLLENGTLVTDSYLRINSDLSTDTIVKFYEYTDTYQPSLLKELGKPMKRLYWDWNDTSIYSIAEGTGRTPEDFTETFLTEFYTTPIEGLQEKVTPNGYSTNYYYDRHNRLFEVTEGNQIPLVRYRYGVNSEDR